jgi:CheY-like chemotaxis protein
MFKFLIVEDSTIDTELLVKWLERYFECRVFCVANAVQAFIAFTPGRYHAVFLNLKLGAEPLAGLEVLKAIRDQELDLPVFIVTGYESEESRRLAIRTGATGFFGKDFNGTEAISVRHLIKMRAKAYEKGTKVKKNWKTSGAGLAQILIGFGSILDKYLDGNVATMPDWGVSGALIAGGIGHLFAADAANKRTKSEEPTETKSGDTATIIKP